MVKHFVAWNFNDKVSKDDKETLKANMKTNLESLVGKVPGLMSAKFYSMPLEGSNREFCLITMHNCRQDIAVYSAHPEHVKVADTFVRPYTKDRICLNIDLE